MLSAIPSQQEYMTVFRMWKSNIADVASKLEASCESP